MNSSTNKADSENPDECMELFCEPLTRITGGVELNLLLKSGVFFGIVTDLNYGGEKSKRFLQDLHREMDKFYKGNLTFISRQ